MESRIKTCFKCGKEKPLTEFYKHPQMADGHLGKCKECTKKDVSENYRNNREYYAKYEQERSKKPDRKEKALEYQRKRRAKYPEKVAAYNAIRSIEQHYCFLCGDVNTEAHHPDYKQPKLVAWLCRACHLAVHGREAYRFEGSLLF